MLDEKKAHICFRSLFAVAEVLAVACFIYTNLKKLSLVEIRVAIALELVLLAFFLSLILTIKLQWDVQYIKPEAEWIGVSKEDMLLLIVSGVLFLVFIALGSMKNSQFLHCVLFQLLSYVAIFWDVKFVRPRMK